MGPQKKKGMKFEGESAEVIENKYRKNVNFWVCAEVIENKLDIDFLKLC
jgi:hypothetical protein